MEPELYLEESAPYQSMARAIEYICANAQRQPELDEIAAAVGLSSFHFQRLFTRWVGISPKRFLQYLTREHAKALLAESASLLQTTHQVGLSSLGRLYDLFVHTEAVTPGEFKSRGAGLTIRYGVGDTPFGECLLAQTERGICRLGFVTTSREHALAELAEMWGAARLVHDPDTVGMIDAIFVRSRAEVTPRALHLHLNGTNFQLQVWQALLEIPPGALTTYGRLAARLGNPGALRAVGTAVGRNPIAFLIPCHRVIRASGDFGAYHYGSTRKMALLAHEFSQLDKKEP